MLIQESLTLQQKLEILSDAAKYDVACTSSGVDRKGKANTMGNAASCGICHSFSADGRCISLLKILMTNACIYDCRYCINRVSNDTLRTFFTPEEICTLTMEFYRRNYIEGLFLSSGILNTPNETMEKIYQTLWQLREVHRFWGYIHVKAIPGADPELIERVGHLADRMSINLELPTSQGLKTLAPAKTRSRILTPMRQIQKGISENKQYLSERKKSRSSPSLITGKQVITPDDSEFLPTALNSQALKPDSAPANDFASLTFDPSGALKYEENSKFVPAGQSTQMIIGATQETDHQILSVTEALYHNFDLKRVFFSAYTALNDDSHLPALGTPPPLLREHRLYQADWLLRFYGFTASELLSEEKPNFNPLIDPKCDWALRNLDIFPVEVARADYSTLLRVPGIGVKSARRILTARRYGKLDFQALKKFGVVLKRAGYFITCQGKMYRPLRFEEDFLTRELVADDKKKRYELEDTQGSYRQLSLFDDFHLNEQPDSSDLFKSLSGQL
ncbi:MAG: putative DNA modification/repair radical SAM protein [Clostridiales bacterium]|nr:putative DNA modification/repair radical SAM protein [Clostridiales bacterium]